MANAQGGSKETSSVNLASGRSTSRNKQVQLAAKIAKNDNDVFRNMKDKLVEMEKLSNELKKLEETVNLEKEELEVSQAAHD